MAKKQNAVLRLLDPETEITYELLLPKEDFQRAFADPKYAQSLLFHAKANNSIYIEEAHNVDNVAESGSEQNEEQAESTETEAGTSQEIEKHTWAYDESMALIRSMATHMEDLNHPKKKKYVFANVANDLVSQGFTVTATMCTVKWKNLLRSYKTAKDNKTKTGRGPSRFMFFDAMDELLGEKPANKCSHTLESSNMDNLNEEVDGDDDTGLPEATHQVINIEKKTPSKRRSGKENFILMKKEEYAKRQKRHEERVALTKRKLAQEDRKIALLEKMVGSAET